MDISTHRARSIRQTFHWTLENTSVGEASAEKKSVVWRVCGNNNYNGLSARVEHRFSNGLYFLNSFTWGRALGDSEQALEYYTGYFQANPQNIYNLKAGIWSVLAST